MWQFQHICDCTRQAHYKLEFPAHSVFRGAHLSEVKARKGLLCEYLVHMAALPPAINSRVIEWFIGDVDHPSLNET